MIRKKRWRKLLFAFLATLVAVLAGGVAWILYVPTLSSYSALDGIPIQQKGYLPLTSVGPAIEFNLSFVEMDETKLAALQRRLIDAGYARKFSRPVAKGAREEVHFAHRDGESGVQVFSPKPHRGKGLVRIVRFRALYSSRDETRVTLWVSLHGNPDLDDVFE